MSAPKAARQHALPRVHHTRHHLLRLPSAGAAFKTVRRIECSDRVELSVLKRSNRMFWKVMEGLYNDVKVLGGSIACSPTRSPPPSPPPPSAEFGWVADQVGRI